MNRRSHHHVWFTALALTLAAAVGFAAAQERQLQPKRIIESPTKQLVRDQSAPAAPAPSDFVNPKVEPGKVKWHAGFAAACEAARKSYKPVLLFHLMGKLDDQFC